MFLYSIYLLWPSLNFISIVKNIKEKKKHHIIFPYDLMTSFYMCSSYPTGHLSCVFLFYSFFFKQKLFDLKSKLSSEINHLVLGRIHSSPHVIFLVWILKPNILSVIYDSLRKHFTYIFKMIIDCSDVSYSWMLFAFNYKRVSLNNLIKNIVTTIIKFK